MKCSRCGRETEVCDKCIYEDDDYICEIEQEDFVDVDISLSDFYCTKNNVLICQEVVKNGVKLH